MILYSTSSNRSFCFNSDNKQSFVDNLALKLANIPGIEYVKAREIHAVDQAVLGTGFNWQCGGIAQLVELPI